MIFIYQIIKKPDGTVKCVSGEYIEHAFPGFPSGEQIWEKLHRRETTAKQAGEKEARKLDERRRQIDAEYSQMMAVVDQCVSFAESNNLKDHGMSRLQSIPGYRGAKFSESIMYKKYTIPESSSPLLFLPYPGGIPTTARKGFPSWKKKYETMNGLNYLGNLLKSITVDADKKLGEARRAYASEMKSRAQAGPAKRTMADRRRDWEDAFSDTMDTYRRGFQKASNKVKQTSEQVKAAARNKVKELLRQMIRQTLRDVKDITEEEVKTMITESIREL